MVQLIEKIKDTPGGFHSWWKSNIGIIRKPNSSAKKTEPKVAEVKLEDKIMAEETKKVLFVLNASNKWNRILRRGVVIFVLAGISAILGDTLASSGQYLDGMTLALITAVLAMIDKSLRELRG